MKRLLSIAAVVGLAAGANAAQTDALDVPPTLRAATTPAALPRRIALAEVAPALEGPLLAFLTATGRIDLVDRRAAKPGGATSEAWLYASWNGSEIAVESAGRRVAIAGREVVLRLVEWPSGKVLAASSAFASAHHAASDVLATALSAWIPGLETPGAVRATAALVPAVGVTDVTVASGSAVPSATLPDLGGARGETSPASDDGPLRLSLLMLRPRPVHVEACIGWSVPLARVAWDWDSSGQVRALEPAGVNGQVAAAWRVRDPISLVASVGYLRWSDSVSFPRRRNGSFLYDGTETHAVSGAFVPIGVGVRYRREAPSYETALDLAGGFLGSSPVDATASGKGKALDPVTLVERGNYAETRTATLEAGAGWFASFAARYSRPFGPRLSAFASLGLSMGSLRPTFRSDSVRRTIVTGAGTIDERSIEAFEPGSSPAVAGRFPSDRWSVLHLTLSIGATFKLL